MPSIGTASRRPSWPLRLAIILVVALAVAGGCYVFGRLHPPDFTSSLFGRTGNGANALKAQLGSVLLGLALLQLLLALWMYRRLPGAGAAPRPVGTVHRASGIVLFLLSVPVAYHCITAYGVQLSSTRVAVHSLAGCFFYGAFVAKVLFVRSHRMPGWVLPAAGGLLIAFIATLWYTAALWQLNSFHTPGL